MMKLTSRGDGVARGSAWRQVVAGCLLVGEALLVQASACGPSDDPGALETPTSAAPGEGAAGSGTDPSGESPLDAPGPDDGTVATGDSDRGQPAADDADGIDAAPEGPTQGANPQAPHDPGTREFNDTATMAAPIAVDELVAGVSLTSPDDPVDFYRIELEVGQTYTFELDSNCSLGYRIDSGANGDGGVLLAPATGTHPVAEFEPGASGPATLRVSYSSTCSVYSFVIRSSTDAGLDHDLLTREPNDSASTAAPLGVDEPVGTVALTELVDPVDFYRLELESGQTYTLELDSSCSLAYRIDAGADAAGGVLLAPATGTHPTVDFTPTVSGPVTLRVGYSSTCSVYRLIVRSGTDAELPHDALTREPNDSANIAAPLAIDESVTGVSLTAIDDTVDFYRVVFEAGQTYTFELDSACSLSYRIDAGKDGASGVLLAPGTGTRPVQEFTPAASGPATVRIGYSSTCSTYTLVIRS